MRVVVFVADGVLLRESLTRNIREMSKTTADKDAIMSSILVIYATVVGATHCCRPVIDALDIDTKKKSRKEKAPDQIRSSAQGECSVIGSRWF